MVIENENCFEIVSIFHCSAYSAALTGSSYNLPVSTCPLAFVLSKQT